MTNSTNPYAPPASPMGSALAKDGVLADMDAATGGQIGFQMHNSRGVISRCYQRRPFGRVAFVVSLFASFVFFVLFVTALVGSGGARVRVSLLVLALLPVGAAMSMMLWLRSRWRKAIGQTPSLLEPTKGYINQLGVQAEQDGNKWFGTWTYSYRVAINKHGVQVSGEPWRLVSLIIPWESFEDEAAARTAMASVVRQREMTLSVPLVATRNKEASTYDDLFLPPSEHVAFSGHVNYRHLLETRAGKRMARKLRVWFLVCSLILVGGVWTFLSQWWLQPAGLFAVIFSSLMLFRLLKNPFSRRRIDGVAMTVRGWISADGLFANTQTGQALSMWSRYVDHEIHESILCLRVPGTVDAWQFLPKSLFASESDFQQACDWAQGGMR